MSDTGEGASALLDRARTGKEIGTLVAVVLLATGGDPDAALTMLDSFRDLAPPESLEELDAVPLAEQAIREAVVLRGRQ
jgi:hypothetical protein